MNKQYVLDTNCKQNKHKRSENEAVLYYMALQEGKDVLYKATVTAPSEKQGKIRASLEILKQLYPSWKWVDLQ